MSTHRDAVLKSVHFDGPDYIPMTFGINRACWDWYKVDELKELMAEHRFLFPDFDPDFDPAKLEYGLNQRADRPYKDPWGCIWETAISGITGSVHGHPLESWDNFDVYEPPDPDSTDGTFPVDWDRSASSVRKNRENGSLVQMGLPHGHTFLRLLDIRGYQNLLFDMADGTDNVKRLIGMVSDFNLEIVGRALALEPDIMGYAEDLGMQVGPMISPDLFREYIKPVYKRLMEPARDRGVLVHMHSDGDIRTLAGDLIEGDRAGHSRVQRSDRAAHRQVDPKVAPLAHQPPHTIALAAHDQRQRSPQVARPQILRLRLVL